MEQLVNDLKKLIVDALELEDVSVDDIIASDPIFGTGLGLDSIDALELGIAIRKKYNVAFSEDKNENRKHFASVNALAEYINAVKD